MKKSVCKYCGKEIGLWLDPWDAPRAWMHQPDDGPDAYEECSDGEVAKPVDDEVHA